MPLEFTVSPDLVPNGVLTEPLRALTPRCKLQELAKRTSSHTEHQLTSEDHQSERIAGPHVAFASGIINDFSVPCSSWRANS
jgi:hypothetical protein